MGSGCARIGHGGASALAPANTLASFDAALSVGVDMIEFDVRAWRGELLLAHTVLDAGRGAALRLGSALRHLADADFDAVELNVDLKHTGFEAALLEQLRGAGLLERTLISCQVAGAIDRVRALEPRARVAISIGGRVARLSRRWRGWRASALAGLTAGRWDALMAQHRLVEPSLLHDVIARGGLLYAWTVNERLSIEQLRALGVHGIATADPRLFALSGCTPCERVTG